MKLSHSIRLRTTPVLLLMLALGVAGLAVVTGCGSASSAAPAASSGGAFASAAAAPETSTVTLMMDWVPWVLDIPVDTAQQQGYYAARGLTVKQIVPAGPTDVVKFVATGKAQFGLYYAPDTLMGVAQGAPLVSVGSLMSHAPVGMATAPGVRAARPADLTGRVVGVVLIPSTRASFQTMLAADGVSPSSVKVADPGFSIVAPLLAGKFAAVSVTQFGELVQAEAGGQKLDYLDFRDWGTPDYAFLNIISQQGFATKNPATVRAFVAATLEGLQYAVQHPTEAVDAYVARHPELKRDLLLAQWKAAMPSMAVAAAHGAGWQDLATWRRLDDWMVKTGQLKQAADVNAAVSNAFLPQP